MRRALLMLVLAASACGGRPGGAHDRDGACDETRQDCGVPADSTAARDGGADDGDHYDPLSRYGGRWNRFQLVKPESIAALANVELPGSFADGTIVVILRSEPLEKNVSVFLQGGDGVKVADDPLTYVFREAFRPGMVLADIQAPFTGSDGKHYTPFATAIRFEWPFGFIPGQPPLYLYRASLSGSLDPEGVPTSNEPPGQWGTLTGCFTATTLAPEQYGAEDVYLEAIGQSLRQLIESSGGTLDCASSGTGSFDGYLLQVKWASEDATADLTWGW